MTSEEVGAGTSSDPARGQQSALDDESAAPPTERVNRHRVRRAFSWVLVVLACLLAVISVFAAFIRNEALNTDTYVSTVAPLASNPDIQAAVAHRVSTQLVARTNLEQQVKQALPPRASFIAGPVTSGVQSAADQIVLKFVQSPAFQKIWVGANRAAHAQVVNLLTGQQQGAFSVEQRSDHRRPEQGGGTGEEGARRQGHHRLRQGLHQKGTDHGPLRVESAEAPPGGDPLLQSPGGPPAHPRPSPVRRRGPVDAQPASRARAGCARPRGLDGPDPHPRRGREEPVRSRRSARHGRSRRRPR